MMMKEEEEGEKEEEEEKKKWGTHKDEEVEDEHEVLHTA